MWTINAFKLFFKLNCHQARPHSSKICDANRGLFCDAKRLQNCKIANIVVSQIASFVTQKGCKSSTIIHRNPWWGIIKSFVCYKSLQSLEASKASFVTKVAKHRKPRSQQKVSILPARVKIWYEGQRSKHCFLIPARIKFLKH